MISAVYHKLALATNKGLEGKAIPVLVTENGKKGGVIARDSSYRTTVIKKDLPLGTSCTVWVKEVRSTYLLGEVQNI
jgi:tRNA A37 methylthiotransferase MiaB